MTSNEPISLGQAKRLAANADTILLRATRDADLETPIGAFLRLDDGGSRLPARVRRGRRATRSLLVPRCRTATAARGPRRRSPGSRLARSTVPTYAPDLPVETSAAHRSARGDPRVRPDAAGSSRPRGCRASPAARSVRSPTTRSRRSSRPCRCRIATRSACPTAAFIETDLVLVFDHLTHTLSAHRLAPHRRPRPRGSLPDRRGGDLRGARADRPPDRRRDRRSRRAARRSDPARRRPRRWPGRSRRASAATSTSGRSRSPRTRSRRRGDPGRPRPPPVVRPAAGRRDRAPRSTGSACTARCAGSTRARTCSSSGPRRSRSSGRRPELLLQVEGDRLTTHPIAGTRPRGAPTAARTRLLAEQLQRDPKERAEHVMLVDLGRNDLGRVVAARAPSPSASTWRSSATATCSTSCRHVEGRLAPELDALDALRAVFPAGTLSGAPKVRAMQLIAAAEGRATRPVRRRGRATSATTATWTPRSRSGAPCSRTARPTSTPAPGSWPASVPEREFEETEHKAAALRRAIELAAGIPGTRSASDTGPEAPTEPEAPAGAGAGR